MAPLLSIPILKTCISIFTSPFAFCTFWFGTLFFLFIPWPLCFPFPFWNPSLCFVFLSLHHPLLSIPILKPFALLWFLSKHYPLLSIPILKPFALLWFLSLHHPLLSIPILKPFALNFALLWLLSLHHPLLSIPILKPFALLWFLSKHYTLLSFHFVHFCSCYLLPLIECSDLASITLSLCTIIFYSLSLFIPFYCSCTIWFSLYHSVLFSPFCSYNHFVYSLHHSVLIICKFSFFAPHVTIFFSP